MLYDQAQLTVSFAQVRLKKHSGHMLAFWNCLTAFFQAYQATGDERFGRAVDDIIEYVNRDMRHPAGGYFRYVHAFLELMIKRYKSCSPNE